MGIFFVSGLAVGSIYALSGVGLVLLYRATGVLNLAYGAIGAAGAMVAWQLVEWEYPAPLAWCAAILLAIVISFCQGRFVAPYLDFREPVIKAVATLGVMLIVLGIVNWIWVENPRRFDLPTDTIGTRLLGVRVTVTRGLVLVLALVSTAGIALYLNKTRMGLLMRSLANNRNIASMIGVPVLKVELVAWIFSGFLSGLTGLMFADLVSMNPNVLAFLVIPAIAAAIVGRLESLWLTLIGGMGIGIIEAMTTLIKPVAPFRTAVPFVVAAIVILWLQRKQRLTFADDD